MKKFLTFEDIKNHKCLHCNTEDVNRDIYCWCCNKGYVTKFGFSKREDCFSESIFKHPIPIERCKQCEFKSVCNTEL